MPQHLHDLFERALDDEPLPPPGDPVRQAMAHGLRIRRRRRLLIGGSSAAAVAAVAAVVAVAVNLALVNPGPPAPASPVAALMAPADPACTWPVTDDATDATLFLSDTITLAQTSALRDALWADPVVRSARFETRSQAYQRFKVLWADSPDFVASVSEDSLPQSFRVDLAEPAGYRQFAARFSGRPGVAQMIGRTCAEGHK